MCDLAEWGVLIDNEDTVKAMMEEYWTPMWSYSFTGEDMDVDAVMDGLDIDRNGADPEEIDDEMAEQIMAAELASAGCAKLDVYEDDEAFGAEPVRIIEPEPEEPAEKKFTDKQVMCVCVSCPPFFKVPRFALDSGSSSTCAYLSFINNCHSIFCYAGQVRGSHVGRPPGVGARGRGGPWVRRRHMGQPRVV